MLGKAISGYWILYVMMGICVIGIGSRLWLARIYSGLLKDVQYEKEPRKKLVRQIKENYETCYRLSEGVSNVEAFLVRNLYGYRFLGMTLPGIQKISGQALFLCIVFGALSAAYTYIMGMASQLSATYAASALAMAVILLYINCVFDAQGRQALLEAGIVDYLQNYLGAVLAGNAGQQMKAPESDQETETENAQQTGNDEIHALRKSTLAGKEEERMREKTPAKKQAQRLLSDLRRRPRGGEEPEPAPAVQMQHDMDYLRCSLNQIAADIEKGRKSGKGKLTEEELKLVEEILGEYLA